MIGSDAPNLACGEENARPFATLIDLLRHRARLRPDQLAYTFLRDGEHEESSLTYAQLDQRARAIAARLQQLEVAGERALLLYPPGLEYLAAFFGCLYAGVVAVPLYPPPRARSERAAARLHAISVDARPAVVLTSTTLRTAAEALFASHERARPAHLLATDDGDTAGAEWQPPAVGGTTLAFLQYTSGSTAAPRGVMLTHANLLHNMELMAGSFALSATTPVVSWLPLHHDMGLIGGVLEPLYAGAPVTLMSPMAFLQRPARWLEAVTRYRAAVSGAPNFAYELCLQRTTPEQRAQLDLSSWSVAFTGAEPIRADTLARFAATFAPSGFRREALYPCYGLAEATLIVTGGDRDKPPRVRSFQAVALEGQQRAVVAEEQEAGRALVGCGRPLGGQRVAIVRAETLTECRPGEVGEVWLAGPSVAQGYWDKPEQSDETFNARLAGSATVPFLRTGDLGFFYEGELFITGRIKDLIIIRGVNHYPQDIELTTERAHPALSGRTSAAFSVEVGAEERLVVVQEVGRRFERDAAADVSAHVRRAVAEAHEVQVYAVVLVKWGTIPKTTSGKIQRGVCRRQFLDGALHIVADSILVPTETSAAPDGARLTGATLLELDDADRQQRLVAFLRQHLARLLKLPAERLSVERAISDFGLDSLTVVELQHEVESCLGVPLPLASILGGSSIEQLAQRIAAAPVQSSGALNADAGNHSPRPAAVTPMSYGQQAMFYLQQLAPESVAYNISRAVRIPGPVNIEALRRTLQTLLDRHEVLRATFAVSHGEHTQRIQDEAAVFFRHERAADWDEATWKARLAAEAQRPFDLARGPLLRAYLFTRSEREHVLLLSVHHIAADLWSLAVLAHELGVLYGAEAQGLSAAALLDPPPARYADYVDWQRAMLDGSEGERLWNFWRQRLGGDLPTLNLPTDRPRPPAQSYTGGSHSALLDAEQTAQLKSLSRECGSTLYMTLLAAFQVLLHRYTGQTDILVGSPAAGRSRARFRNVFGYFVNPLVMRAGFGESQTFRSFLGQTRRDVLDAFDHQDYPFSLLAEKLQPVREPGRSPIFQVMFVMQQASVEQEAGLLGLALEDAGARIHLAQLPVEAVPLERHTAQFDLTMIAAETNAGLRVALDYNSDLFEPDTARRLLEHFLMLLRAVAAQPDEDISGLSLFTAAERQRLLVEWNATATEYDATLCLQHLFESQAERTPDATAVVAGAGRLSYRELNARANRVAHYLRARGCGAETLIGVCLERSAELPVALLGILKAGGAYVPLDPSYPQERLAHIIKDTRAALVLTERGLADRLPAVGAPLVCLDADDGQIARAGESNPATPLDPNNLAYVIYTSGSTGRPKGVAITHSNAVALIDWARRTFTREQLAGVLAATSITFDLSVFEIFAPLGVGGTVIMAENALLLPAEPDGPPVTLVNTVPSVMTELLRGGRLPASVRTVNLAGEVLPASLAAQLYGEDFVEQVYNLYGPSEDTTYSTCALVPEDCRRSPSIGRPLTNKEIYLLDARLEPVPIGVTGELYTGGAGLTRGYLNQPELTAERFIPHPFSQTPGQRLYRTGDLARYRANGELEFLGRADQQVKVRGFRVELGEIESAFREHPAVRECVVLLREDSPGDKRLVAYVVPTNEQAVTTNDDLRAFARARLPEHMIPAAFIKLLSLPLTSHGKLDRRALPAPPRARPQTENEHVAPRTELEHALADLWGELLGFDRVGVHDDFFNLGGHSLLASRLVSRVSETLQVEVPLRRFFETPTVAGVAAYIETVRWLAQRAAGSQPAAADVREEGSL